MTFAITQEYIFLELIKKRLRSIRNKERESMVAAPEDHL
jgi:hypothetical protein